MRNFLASILEKITEKLKVKELKTDVFEKKEDKKTSIEVKKLQKDKKKSRIERISPHERSLRDFAEMMENPFLALSKNRRNPIIYESPDGTRKIKVTRHTGHFLASIYDFDIIIFIASKMQEIINSRTDIPPRTMIIPMHEILKALHKENGSKQQKDLVHSLQRLQLTGIDTTIRNEDRKYRAGFGFLDDWGYVERESDRDIKKIRITISQWLYDGICAQGALLKVSPSYFGITSALKRFLYRTARKHAGNSEKNERSFFIETLYEKSGSENDFRKFKSKIKKVVLDNKIPDYYMELIEENGKEKVLFKKHNFQDNIQELDRLAEEGTKNSKTTMISIS